MSETGTAVSKQISVVVRLCNYHAQAIWHLVTMELAQTPACSLILSRIDYYNAVLHGAPSYSIKKLQRVQNNAARIVLQAPRRSHASPLLRMLHWLPIQQRIEYKVALLMFKVRNTTVYDVDICKERFLMLISGCLKLTTENCSQ